jgi:2-isopropylmalate synthase
MTMSTFDYRKYSPYPRLHKSDRRWPDKVITQAPHWCSVDLRDGNQALIEPMTPEQKLQMFLLLVDVGFKEIEVGFPAASQMDFDFVRQLIEENLIPDDVTIQVLTQAREDLIVRSFASLRGAKRAIVHLYNSTSKVQRKHVFGKSKNEIKALAVQGAQWVKACAKQQPDTDWQFQYSPESFTGTELEYAVEVCNAVSEVWQPTIKNPVIINLPATVEMTTPNVYADQIEWMCDHIKNRQAIIISLHTHNDRGCGIAAAELGVMAGADRIEGTLLGNGERTGNMDIVTMAMNLYSRGVKPQLDLSSMDRIIHTVESCTQLKLHPRHPYAGELVFAAFSGSHQDAINKCLHNYNEGDTWDVAYLPIDPRDIGRSYQQVIRINSQSGKGGIAYVMKQQTEMQIPRWLQVDFSSHVQSMAENKKTEMSAQSIAELFDTTYVNIQQAMVMEMYSASYKNNHDQLVATINQQDKILNINGQGNGMLDAFVCALSTVFKQSLVLIEYNEHSLGKDEQAQAIAYVQISVNGNRVCGVARSSDIVKASFQAVLNACGRSDVYNKEGLLQIDKAV